VPNGRESIFVYRSDCCKVVLQVAIFPSRRRTIIRNGTVFVEENWNVATRSFDFKESTMVRMKVLVSVLIVARVASGSTTCLHQPPPPNGNEVPPLVNSPWTIAGKAAAKKAALPV
jgi:hypothetical protein